MKITVRDSLAIFVLILSLISIRIFEDKLFYDPLLYFFKTEAEILPRYDITSLFLGLAFRYGLNMILSLGILWIVFKDKSIFQLSIFLYITLFIILAGALFITLKIQKPNLIVIFYLRRFIIQPLLLIILLPAYYYQKRMR